MKMQIIFLFFCVSLVASGSIGLTTQWTVYRPPTYSETEGQLDSQMSDTLKRVSSASSPTTSYDAKSVLSDETRSLFRVTSEHARKIEALAKYAAGKGDTPLHSQKVNL